MTAKDVALALMGRLGVSGGSGHALEFAGPLIDSLSMEQRMTICNMSIEAGARSALIAPDATTFAFLEGRPHAPKGDDGPPPSRAGRRSPSDPGRALRRRDHDRCHRARAARDLGHASRHGRAGHRPRAGSERRRLAKAMPARWSARSPTWA